MIPFSKMQGNGNDFIVVDNRGLRASTESLSALAARACRRRQSLGADGLLVVEASGEADFSMRLFNADGSEGEMCGNGARCIALYAHTKGIAGADQSFSTPAGVMRAKVAPPVVTLDMGRIDLTGGWTDRGLPLEGRSLPTSFFIVGVPHVMVFTGSDMSRADMVRLGRTLRYDGALFPSGANVNFVRQEGNDAIAVTTYERGVEDLTDSCGTGSAASAIAHVLRRGPVPPSASVTVQNPGGVNVVDLRFSAGGEGVEAFLSGPAVFVADGMLYDALC